MLRSKDGEFEKPPVRVGNTDFVKSLAEKRDTFVETNRFEPWDSGATLFADFVAVRPLAIRERTPGFLLRNPGVLSLHSRKAVIGINEKLLRSDFRSAAPLRCGHWTCLFRPALRLVIIVGFLRGIRRFTRFVVVWGKNLRPICFAEIRLRSQGKPVIWFCLAGRLRVSGYFSAAFFHFPLLFVAGSELGVGRLVKERLALRPVPCRIGRVFIRILAGETAAQQQIEGEQHKPYIQSEALEFCIQTESHLPRLRI